MANHNGPPGPFEDEPQGENGENLEQVSDDLRRLYHLEAEANTESLSKVFARLQASERARPLISPAADGNLLPFPTLSSSSAPKGTHPMKNLKTTDISPSTQAQLTPRRSAPFAPSRLTGVAAVLATALLLTGALWGFLYFHGQRVVSPGPNQQLTATLRCQSTPFGLPGSGSLEAPPVDNPLQFTNSWQPPLDWSARGDISYAIPTTTFFAGDTCATLPLTKAAEKYLAGGDFAQVVWSPDGTRLLLLAQPASVFDATTGHNLVNLQIGANIGLPAIQRVAQAVWTADGTQIITVSITARNTATNITSEQVQVWDSQTGALIRTALSLTNVAYGTGWISPNGAYAAAQLPNHSIQFWDIATGQLLSTTSAIATGSSGAVSWSPDGSLFASVFLGPNLPDQVQIWSSATGQLVTTLTDPESGVSPSNSKYFVIPFIDGLAWSPNGEYLAEISGQINIWSTTSWQRVATFGKVDNSAPTYSQIESVTWSPDGSMLATVTSSFGYVDPRSPGVTDQGYRLNVWQLSYGTAPTPTPLGTLIPSPVATPSVLPAGSPSVTPVATPTLSPAETPSGTGETPTSAPAATATPMPGATPTVTPIGN